MDPDMDQAPDRPRIGIPLTLDDRGRWRSGRAYHYIDRRYADAIDAAGGLPIQLPIQSDVAALVATLDGLLLPGGDDFPSETPLAEGVVLDPVAADQLAFDEALYEAFDEDTHEQAGRKQTAPARPLLAICYGMQLIARRRGGRLVSDLASQRPESGPHRLADEDRHPISIEPDSRLAVVVGQRTLSVNSLHRQAVCDPGAGWRAVAHAPDGVIEAIEPIDASTTERFALGVQWHPEKLDDEASRSLFAALVEAARKHAAARRAGS